jgi:hypothetical protein
MTVTGAEPETIHPLDVEDPQAQLEHASLLLKRAVIQHKKVYAVDLTLICFEADGAMHVPMRFVDGRVKLGRPGPGWPVLSSPVDGS